MKNNRIIKNKRVDIWILFIKNCRIIRAAFGSPVANLQISFKKIITTNLSGHCKELKGLCKGFRIAAKQFG